MSDKVQDIQNLFSFASQQEQQLIIRLCQAGQEHIFEPFRDASKHTRQLFAAQLNDLDQSYPNGGIEGYMKNARLLLDNSRKGVNPLEGWEPSVPEGERFDLGTKKYQEAEALGMKEMGNVGFVLVAGGLGERLGYSGIKVGLPTEITTETCYLQYYIEYILAVQKKWAPKGRQLPLCIMTSGDTNEKTLQLLHKNHYFGMQKSQITIVQQGQGVPALADNNASLVLDKESMKLVTKPHGHGDIHALLYNHGVAKAWVDMGIKWLTLFQDTNGLAFHTLPLMLGVSSRLDLIMNSLAVPRKAKQAIGAITKLKHKETGEVK